MANYMNPQNYNNMIRALNNFAAKTAETCQQLNTACAQAISVLGEEDVASDKITTAAGKIRQKYAGLAKEAKRIAAKMQQELEDHYEKERNLNPDQMDDGDDDF